MNRTPAIFSLILLMTALVVCDDLEAATASSESGNAEATRESVEQLVRQFNDAILNQDQAALNGFISSDFASGGDRILTKPEYVDQIVTNAPPKTQSIDSMSVTLYGDTAVVTGIATAEWVSPARIEMKSFRWVNVWHLGENGWQVVYSQSTLVMSDMDC